MACIAPQGASWPLAVLELRFQKVPGCPSDFCLLISPAHLWAFCCFTVCVNRPQIPELSPPPWTPSSLPANSGWGGRGHPVRVHACPPHPRGPVRMGCKSGGRGEGPEGGRPERPRTPPASSPLPVSCPVSLPAGPHAPHFILCSHSLISYEEPTPKARAFLLLMISPRQRECESSEEEAEALGTSLALGISLGLRSDMLLSGQIIFPGALGSLEFLMRMLELTDLSVSGERGRGPGDSDGDSFPLVLARTGSSSTTRN